MVTRECWYDYAMICPCKEREAVLAARHVRSARALDPLDHAALVACKAGQSAFFPGGIVSMMDRIATATMNTLNMSAIIAAVRIATLS